MAALRDYDILDTPSEAEFDDIVKLAAEICGTPISLISLVETDRQWFKAKTGVDISETPINQSICAHAILDDDITIIQDTTLDPRSNCNTLVTGDPNLRFYAGAVLQTKDKLPIGMLCVLDYKPSNLNEQQTRALKTLAHQVMVQLELRHALKQQRNVESHLGAIITSSDDAIISKNLSGTITSWNKAAERIFGYSAEEIIGKSIKTLIPQELQSEEDEILTTLKTGKRIDHFETMRRHKNGTLLPVSITVSPIRDQSGNIIGASKISRDITERKKLETTLQTALTQAEEANLAKTEFLANMSHEIRTPMNAVIGLSNILSKSDPLTLKQREFVKTLQMSADSLLGLINDLLDIAKIEARNVELEHIPFSVVQMVQESISMVNVRAREKDLTFTVVQECPCIEKRQVVGDPTRLRQILLNLCSNAIKFTEKGGVTLHISCDDAQIEGKELISIAVQDTGIGIPANKIDDIFQKFTQADSSINRKYGGTGLGLAITKTLAEIMGGTIELSSKVGVGSTFTVKIPFDVTSGAAIPQYSPRPRTAEPTHAQDSKGRILLVEDYEPNVLVATTFLEGFGYHVDVANNGQQAIDKMKATRYIAALMDVQMHGMNGLEATQIVRAYEKQNNKPKTYIIGMTAHALIGDRERCIAVGMDDYISKPFNPDELEKMLEQLARTNDVAA